MTAVFRHGALRLYLLKLLDEQPRHGYEVISLLEDRFFGLYAPSAGTVYPRLSKLEEEGLIEHDDVEGRKTYRLTDAGREELTHQRDAIRDLEQDISRSVSELAKDIRSDVRESVRELRDEIKQAAREVRRETRAATRQAHRDGLVPLIKELDRLRKETMVAAARGGPDDAIDRAIQLVRRTRTDLLALFDA